MMIKEVTFCETYELCETYSLEEYDRKNADMPSWIIQANAWRGGEWWKKYKRIQEELRLFKRAEITTAYENSLENLKNTHYLE